MKSIYRLAILLAATAMLIATIVPAGAQLTSMTYGFPSIYQNALTTAFSRDIVSATDLETLNIDFGTAVAGACGLGFGGFPSISQTVEKTYYAESMDYLHTEETSAFNYPYAGVGGLSGLPFC